MRTPVDISILFGLVLRSSWDIWGQPNFLQDQYVNVHTRFYIDLASQVHKCEPPASYVRIFWIKSTSLADKRESKKEQDGCRHAVVIICRQHDTPRPCVWLSVCLSKAFSRIWESAINSSDGDVNQQRRISAAYPCRSFFHLSLEM